MITLLNIISKISMFTLVCCLIYFILYFAMKFFLYLQNKIVTKNTEFIILIISFILTLTQFTFHDIY